MYGFVMCGCVYVLVCNVWVCVCMGFEMRECVYVGFVMCGVVMCGCVYVGVCNVWVF
jgi:hypothetical protein